MDCEVVPGGRLQGEWVVPGDKSISHRALLLGAISNGKTDILGFLFSEDCLATLKALQQCGIEFSSGPDHVTVYGKGFYGLTPPSQSIDCQNSGTTFRLLAGLLAAQPFSSCLIGDQSLSKRPMKRIVDPLTQMGAVIRGREQNDQITAPLMIEGKGILKGIDYAIPVASAQVKSCLLLAGLMATGESILTEVGPTRDHTERMLQAFGASIQNTQKGIHLIPGRELIGQTVHVPGDLSSAAFFIAGASLAQGSELLLRRVGVNSTRTGILSILKAMGADITVHNHRLESGEPVADIQVKSAILRGIHVPQEWVVSAIDEFPIIFVVAALAQGTTTISGIEELRYKETDRLSVMANELRKLGAKMTLLKDGIVIEGGALSGGTVQSEGDHRIAMALAIAGLKTTSPLVIKDIDNIATSFPGFIEFANQCGLTITSSQS